MYSLRKEQVIRSYKGEIAGRVHAALSAWLQMLAPLGTARRRIATIRRLLIHRAARWTTTARRDELHFTAEAQELIAQVLARIRAHRHLLAA